MSHRLVIFCVVIALSGQFIANDSVYADPVNTSPLVSRTLLEHSDMAQVWQINLPLKPLENIDRMRIFDDYLYVLTDSNYLFCIDRAKGTVRFGVILASASLPVCDPYYDGQNLTFIVGNRIISLDPDSGVINRSRDLPNVGRSAVCAMDGNDKFFYVPGANKRLNVLAIDGLLKSFTVTADNDSLINSVIADNDLVVFATQTGNVVSIEADEPKKIWQYDAPDGISAPIVRDESAVYVSSLDSKLYKIDIATGKPLWKNAFQAGQSLTKSVRVGKKYIYQYAGPKGVYAIDKETGSSIWQLDKGLEMLSEKGQNAYLFAEPGNLVVMDNESAKMKYSVNFSQITDYAVNTIDSAIYAAADNGRVMSIKIIK